MKRADEEELAVIAEIAVLFQSEGLPGFKDRPGRKNRGISDPLSAEAVCASGDRTKAQIWTERSTGGHRPL